GAIRVPRTRFLPVKKCQDLLVLWSDYYVLTESSTIIKNPKSKFESLKIDLDDRYYKTIDQLKERFPHGTPSLIDCNSLKIEGNVYFGKGIVINGNINIVSHAPKKVSLPEGMFIDKDLYFD
ncbi:MAG TPA: UTP--glucose-1-phosphate uridylyltransferase, partial [Desulfatiglandales bacterium]|nr:UTP--glucose-1-phosphate uridylyltransferase [Desulfatiglandales bacterium]